MNIGCSWEGQQPSYSENRCGQSYSDICFKSAQIAVLTVARQHAHYKRSFDISFSPQLSAGSSGRPTQTMPFRQSKPFKQCYSDTPGSFFVCDPKITAFFIIKLLVLIFSFCFEVRHPASRCCAGGLFTLVCERILFLASVQISWSSTSLSSGSGYYDYYRSSHTGRQLTELFRTELGNFGYDTIRHRSTLPTY